MPLDPQDGYPYTEPSLAISAGSAENQAHQYAIDIDLAMRSNYSINLKRVSQTIYPLLYAEANLSGGRYTLCVDEHTTYVCQDSQPVYAELKSIAHIPLGIYSIIFSYSEYPLNGQWIKPLADFLGVVTQASLTLAQLGLSPSTNIACREIITQSMLTMQKFISEKNFAVTDYENYCASISSHILTAQKVAAEDQVRGMLGYLDTWKKMMGDAQWDKLYVMCQCIWTVSKESAHELIIKSTMKETFHETNIISSEAIPTLADAKYLLARVLTDRVMAAIVFKVEAGVDYANNIFSLSTERDLQSQAINTVISGLAGQVRCPLGHG